MRSNTYVKWHPIIPTPKTVQPIHETKTLRRYKMSNQNVKYTNVVTVDNFIHYPRFKKIIDDVERIRRMSKRSHVPYGIVIEGPTGLGKSSILDVLEVRYPVRETPEGIEIPFFRIETPSPVT